MFFALDESKEHSKMVIGGILMPVSNLPEFEKRFTELRIKHKTFGELKWEKLSKAYLNKYIEFVNLFLDDKDITYHSMCYRHDKYLAAYKLIRTVTWKLTNDGIREPLYVLFDHDDDGGAVETKKIYEIASKSDSRFDYPIVFCSQGASKVIGALQVADMVTGAVSESVNKVTLSDEHEKFNEHLVKKNSGVELGWSPLYGLPKLKSLKIQYFDPDDKPKRGVVPPF